MATPAEVSKERSNFRIRQFKEKCHFNIAANLTLNTMASFVILLIARTARIACVDRHTYRDTHETTTVTLAAHACAPRVNYVSTCVRLLSTIRHVLSYLSWLYKSEFTSLLHG